MKVAAKVYETKDYSSFKRLEGNRAVVNSRKNRIITSISEVGYVLNPIIVNESMEVIDGQGRLEALKELGLPVHYIIAQNVGLDECIAMNIHNSIWKVEDFVNCYAEMGDKNYIYLTLLKKQFPNCTWDTLYSAVTNSIVCNGYETSAAIKNRKLKVSAKAYEIAINGLNFLRDVKEDLDKIEGSGRVKCTSIVWAVRNTDCDRTRMKKILKTRWPEFRKVLDKKPNDFLEDLSNAYNKRLALDKCIDFDFEFKRFKRERSRK